MALFDPYGRELKEREVKKPLLEMVGAVRVRDQWSSYPSVKLTPDKLAGIFREADAGDVIRQAELFEEMEEKDPDLASLFGTRKLAMQGLDLEILPASDSAEDKKIADAVKANIDDLDIDEAVLDLMDAVAKGAAFSEINWQMDAGRAWVAGLEWIHQKRFTYMEMSADWNRPLPKAPKLLTDKEPIHGEDIPLFKLVYHRYKARSGFAPRAGLMRTVGYYYLFKNYDIKDWVIFLEKFGQPLRIGKFSPGASQDDIKVLKEALTNLGTDAAALISDTTMLEIVEAKMAQQSGDLYERAANFYNKSYAKAILGQTATTEGTPGQLGAEPERGEVRHDLLEADAKALARTLRQQLVWPMVGFNDGWDKALPKLRFQIEESEDLEKLSRTHKYLVEVGTPIPVSYVQRKYGIPAPEGDEPILVPPQPQPFLGSIVNSQSSTDKKKVPIGSRLVDLPD